MQLHCVVSIDVHVADDALSPQYPWQQGTSVEHAEPSGEQDGASQKQEPPDAQEISCSNASYMTQESPAQHSPPPTVQTWKFCAQLGGAVQTPPWQVSPPSPGT